MRGIVIHEELTDEWQKRGAIEQRDYEILTAEISKATFGVTPAQYKKIKKLKRENLRDLWMTLNKYLQCSEKDQQQKYTARKIL